MLDSDVVIWCLRGRAEEVRWVARLNEDDLPACSALTVLEVEIGMKPKEVDPTRRFLSSLDVQPVDTSVASEAATLIRRYRPKGVTLDFVDAVIAATCLLRQFHLATYNRRHYPIPELVFAAPVHRWAD